MMICKLLKLGNFFVMFSVVLHRTLVMLKTQRKTISLGSCMSNATLKLQVSCPDLIYLKEEGITKL